MATWLNDKLAKITLPTPFAVGDVNVFLLKGDALTLIDAGVKTCEAWECFLHELETLGYTASDIDQVLLTHHHPDHVGLLDYLDNIPVLAHEKSKRWLQRDKKFTEEYRQFFGQLYSEYAVPKQFHATIQKLEATLQYSCHRSLTDTLKEGMSVPGHPDWTVIETPGHAQSHISFINEKERLMIGGDHILAKISSNPILEPPLAKGMERPQPLIQYNHSLEKIKRFSIEEVFTGHGEEVREVTGLIDERLAKQHERAMKVKAMLVDNPLTGFQICTKLFPTIYERELSLAMSETIGQLDYLTNLGEITTIFDDNGNKLFIAG